MIPLKSPQEIKIMREGGAILATILKEIESVVKPGISTDYLNKLAQALLVKFNAQPAFLGYEGFPAVLCTCVNHEVVHSVPGNYLLKEGDILSLDFGIKYKGFFTDMAVTLPVGKIDFEAMRLLKVTKKALKLGIKKAKEGNTIGDIGNTIQRYVESQGFNVVRDLCGHGIGRKLHEDPKIPNYGKRHKGEKIKKGMVFCIEPMVTMGDWHLKKSKDGFGFETKDGSLSCHFEHTVAVGEEGPEILTKID